MRCGNSQSRILLLYYNIIITYNNSTLHSSEVLIVTKSHVTEAHITNFDIQVFDDANIPFTLRKHNVCRAQTYPLYFLTVRE